MKTIKMMLKEIAGIHSYSRDVIQGSFQLTVILYLLAAVLYKMAPYTPDYLRCVQYYQAALETAPVVLAAGVISALLCDLVLRKTKTDEKTDDRDKKK